MNFSINKLQKWDSRSLSTKVTITFVYPDRPSEVMIHCIVQSLKKLDLDFYPKFIKNANLLLKSWPRNVLTDTAEPLKNVNNF